ATWPATAHWARCIFSPGRSDPPSTLPENIARITKTFQPRRSSHGPGDEEGEGVDDERDQVPAAPRGARRGVLSRRRPGGRDPEDTRIGAAQLGPPGAAREHLRAHHGGAVRPGPVRPVAHV